MRIFGIILFFLVLFGAVYQTVQASHSQEAMSTVLGVEEAAPFRVSLENPFPSFIPLPAEDKAFAIDAHTLWDVVQTWRTENGLSPYNHTEQMCRIAQERLADVEADWSHNGFSWERFCPEANCTLSENLARRYTQESSVLQGWLDSPTHAENLRKDHPDACIATDGTYIVFIMGRFAE